MPRVRSRLTSGVDDPVADGFRVDGDGVACAVVDAVLKDRLRDERGDGLLAGGPVGCEALGILVVEAVGGDTHRRSALRALAADRHARQIAMSRTRMLIRAVLTTAGTP